MAKSKFTLCVFVSHTVLAHHADTSTQQAVTYGRIWFLSLARSLAQPPTTPPRILGVGMGVDVGGYLGRAIICLSVCLLDGYILMFESP